MSNQISISFKVAGGELDSYIKSIQTKSRELTNTALAGAREQAEAGKQQISIINDQIAAIDRKTRIEIQAARSIALEQRQNALNEISNKYEGKRETIFSNRSLSESDMKNRIISVDGQEKEEIRRIKSEYRDNLTVLKEQERQSKIQTQLSREQIDTLKQTARENVRAIIQGDKSLESVISSAQTDDEKLVAKLTQEGLASEKKRVSKDDGINTSILGSLLTADNFNKMASGLTQLTQTNNGFDAIQNTGSSIGKLAGGIIGGLIGSLAGGVGAMAGAGIGSSILGEIMGDAASLKQKQGILSQENLRARYRYNAITGFSGSDDVTDMSSVGVNVTDFIKRRSEFARRRGFASDSDSTTRDAIYSERALGVDQSTSSLLIELQRSSKEGNRDLASLIGGILERGKNSIFPNNDTTFLNEFINKFSSLQKELLKSQTTVSTGLTMDILKQFNSMGGMFDARDPRSSGIISSINNSLANPDSDNMKALEYGILRKQMPNKGIFDLREEMSKGLGSPALLRGLMEQIDNMGGDDQAKMNNLSGALKGVPLSAIRTLFQNRKGLRNFDTSELKGIGLTESILKGKAEKNTADIDRISAENINRTLSGSPLQASIDAISDALKSSLSGAVIELKNGQGTIKLMSQESIIKNNTRRATSQSNNPLSYVPELRGVK